MPARHRQSRGPAAGSDLPRSLQNHRRRRLHMGQVAEHSPRAGPGLPGPPGLQYPAPTASKPCLRRTAAGHSFSDPSPAHGSGDGSSAGAKADRFGPNLGASRGTSYGRRCGQRRRQSLLGSKSAQSAALGASRQLGPARAVKRPQRPPTGCPLCRLPRSHLLLSRVGRVAESRRVASRSKYNRVA